METTTEVSTVGYMSVEELDLGSYVAIGMGTAGVAVLVSIAVLGFISWFKRG